MKIMLVKNFSNSEETDDDYRIDNLKEKLFQNGHQVELIAIPFLSTSGEKRIENILSCRLLNIETADRVIAFHFPSYFIKHPKKIIWLLNRDEYLPGEETIEGGCINLFFKEAFSIFTSSIEVMDRLKKLYNIQSDVLDYPSGPETVSWENVIGRLTR